MGIVVVCVAIGALLTAALLWNDESAAIGVLIGALAGFLTAVAVVFLFLRRAWQRLLAVIEPPLDSARNEAKTRPVGLRPMADLQTLLRLALQRERQFGTDLHRAAMGRELHHRLRNSLQIINSLLTLQISHETNVESAFALRRTLLRSLVIGIVYRSAESEEPGALIDFQTIVVELVEQAQRIFRLPFNRPVITSGIHAPPLPADTAIPMNLALAEILIVIAAQPVVTPRQFCRIEVLVDPQRDALVMTIASPLLRNLTADDADQKALTQTMLSSCASQLHGALEFFIDGSVATCRLIVPRLTPGN
jgi:hypothetical protein